MGYGFGCYGVDVVGVIEEYGDYMVEVSYVDLVVVFLDGVVVLFGGRWFVMCDDNGVKGC